MNFLTKSLLLSITGGIVFILFFALFSVFFILGENGLTFKCCNYEEFNNIGRLVMIGFICIFITATFGVPLLYVVEKYFIKYKYRYIFGSILSGYMIFSVINFFPQSNGFWIPSIRDFILFIAPAFLTGLTFTFLVSFIESRKK